MALLHGQEISADMIEREVSSQGFSPIKFAGLCNSVVWALSGRHCDVIPSFTERVNAPDQGVDAEWDVELPAGEGFGSPLLGPGWNVFQYKKRDVFSRGRSAALSGLKAGVQGAVEEVWEKKGRRPDRYVVFCNVDLGPGKARQLTEVALTGYDEPETVDVSVVGAGELAALLNDVPHVRRAFFGVGDFKTWEGAWLDHSKETLLRASAGLIGREAELDALRSSLAEASVRAVVITGPADVGKTRLALEGTKHLSSSAVFAMDPSSLRPQDLCELEVRGRELIVVAEDPDPQSVEGLIDVAMCYEGIKLIVTLPTPEGAGAGRVKWAERVRHIALGPISREESERLLDAAGGGMDYSLRAWVLHQAGGNPGILLYAVAAGPELRHKGKEFLTEVAGRQEARIRNAVGEKAIEGLRLLALMTQVGVYRAASKEIKMICELFGEGTTANSVLSSLEMLEKTGAVRIRGSYAEVTPPPLANHLAISALRGRAGELVRLVGCLGQPGVRRLIGRLSVLEKCDEVKSFWEAVFGQGGPLEDLRSALSIPWLLREAATAVPGRVTQMVESGLRGMPVERRREIKGHARRQLMWALDELLFRGETSWEAVQCVASLAEAETESYGNNATGVLLECFHPLHPQFPLTLKERVQLIKELTSPDSSAGRRVLAVRAIESALELRTLVFMREGGGPSPLDSRPMITHGDVREYVGSLFDLLLDLAESGDNEVATAAAGALPRALEDYALGVAPGKASEGVRRAGEIALGERFVVSISHFSAALRRIRSEVKERAGEPDEATEGAGELLDVVDGLIRSVEEGAFELRLKRHAGSYDFDDDEAEGGEGREKIYAYQRGLESLAKEAVEAPEVLGDELLVWLCSGKGQKWHEFFWLLGKVDTGRRLLSRLVEFASDEKTSVALSPYLGGLCQHSSEGLDDVLDELSDAHRVDARVIVVATLAVGGSLAGVERMERLLKEGRVEGSSVGRLLKCGGWVDKLSDEEFLRLVKAVAGPDLGSAAASLELCHARLYMGRGLEDRISEFAWECLGSAAKSSEADSYCCDQLAAVLARADSERGFELFEKLLRDPRAGSWRPFRRHLKNALLNVLLDADAARALSLIVSACLQDPLRRLELTWDLKGVLDQRGFADVLVEIALQGEDEAAVVSDFITAGEDGFWEIAVKVLEKYPESKQVGGALCATIDGSGEVIAGPFADHLENRRRDVERILNDRETPAAALCWLRRVECWLKERVEKERTEEADEEVNM